MIHKDVNRLFVLWDNSRAIKERHLSLGCSEWLKMLHEGIWKGILDYNFYSDYAVRGS